ncbi:DUF6805 domain-containing protein [Sinomicrobium soli]|uniref:DUF6805 domain-containing protein n=1 Tax=Sinomicrobium sp. N-1-3-6 TaxID=2219864 RepID=UPI001F2B5672|nr:DUF6805 domain-containing protein [Sinomicrobium sp. N-1-3-6]
MAQGKSYPLDEAPMILAQPGEHPEDAVRAVTGKPMTFKASSVIYPQKYKNLELVPFYTIYDARYMVYWPVEEREGLEEKLRTVRKREKEKLELEARTVDQVAPGEQQPETEHNYRGEQTSSGMNKGMFWRQSESWFSYDLNNTGKQGKVLRVEYYGGDKNRHFGILVNGELLKDVSLQGGKGDVIYHEDYRIPDTVLEKSTGGRITVKFVAKDRTTAGPVYGIRLLRP